MQKIITWVKANPWLAGLIGVGVLIVVFLMFAGSGSATGASVNSDGLSDKEIDSNTQITMAKIAAQAQASGLSLESSKDEHQFEIQIASLSNDRQLSAAQLQSTEKIALAQMDTDKYNTAINASVATAQYQAEAEASKAQTQAQVTQAQIAANAQVSAAKAAKKHCAFGFCW